MSCKPEQTKSDERAKSDERRMKHACGEIRVHQGCDRCIGSTQKGYAIEGGRKIDVGLYWWMTSVRETSIAVRIIVKMMGIRL